MVSVRQFKFDYPKMSSKFILADIGDIHAGNKGVDKSHLKRTVNWIKYHADAVIGTGDYAECINVGDPRFDWDSLDREIATPDEQFDWVADQLEPIADKFLGLVKGNHEYELWRRYNHDYTKDLAEALGTEVWDYSAFTRLRFIRGSHRTKFDVYTHHGKTASRTKGGKINKVRSMDRIFDADVYVMAHVHDLDGDYRPYLTVDNGLKIVEKRKYYALAGGFLRGYVEDMSNYVERGMYAPTSVGSIFVEFTPEKNVFPSIRVSEIPVSRRNNNV